MIFGEKWIWLPDDLYPNKQKTHYSAFYDDRDDFYTVAEFKRNYTFEKRIASAKLRFSGDTQFWLYCNGKSIATGPVLVGGDFMNNDVSRSNFYASEITIEPDGNCLDFYARVKMTPVRICEFSKGHGGFMLTGCITFEDGTKKIITTDSSWLVRYNGAYTRINYYDARIKPDEYVNAKVIDNIWRTETSPLRLLSETKVFPAENNVVALAPHEETVATFEFDMVHAGYLELDVKTDGNLFVDMDCCELEAHTGYEGFVFTENCVQRGTLLHSVGILYLRLRNESETASEIRLSLIATHYPVDREYITRTDDELLNKVLDVCRHTLKYCRQSIHLDSPKHCEPLACTGDYYIESLMTAYSFGDMTLVEEDVLRTAELLRSNDGRIAHTSYSMIWTFMLYDAYLYTGKTELLEKCEDALILLLDRFSGYVGENGIVEYPPDYMFVDWIYIDGITLHHPPKALGQSCLNMFYYGALDTSAKIYSVLGETAMAEECNRKKEALRKGINEHLYDSEKGMYFEGMNTPTPEYLLNHNMPQNVEKRYYAKHANILAAYVGVVEGQDAKELLDKIMNDEIPGDYQPYFAHFLLEALYKNGLRDKYLLNVLQRWKPPVEKFAKGLVEGFIPPEPTYSFDYSHAWGGTPLYILPRALLGLDIIKAGLSELSLSPSLLGLKSAHVEFPTPYGDVVCDMEEGKDPSIVAPEEIKITFEKK